MNRARRIEHVDVERYLAGERDGERRHEYIDGELFAMVGASRRHNVLTANLARLLGNALVGTGCRVTVSDMKVRVESGTRFYYPDVMVSCGDARDEPDEHYETRPALIVEVLSPSTEAIDRREKRLAYATIASLEEYLLVAQGEPRIELFRRDGDGWSRTVLGAHDTLELVSIDGLALPVAALYTGVSHD